MTAASSTSSALKSKLARLLGQDWYRAKARTNRGSHQQLSRWREELRQALEQALGLPLTNSDDDNEEDSSNIHLEGEPRSLIYLLGIQQRYVDEEEFILCFRNLLTVFLHCESLSCWGGSHALSSGLATEVCEALLEVQSRLPLWSKTILQLLLGHYAAATPTGSKVGCRGLIHRECTVDMGQRHVRYILVDMM